MYRTWCKWSETLGVGIKKGAHNSSWVEEQMHLFAWEILQQLLNCNIMHHLELLVDVAVKKSSQCNPGLVKGISPEELNSYFDIVNAICSAVALVLPNQVSSCSNPLFSDLKSMIAAIPSNDMIKLKLFFHPDCISQVLCCVPTNAKAHMSTICMETLNGLCDVEGLSTNVMSKIEELDKLCWDALLCHGGGDALSGAERWKSYCCACHWNFQTDCVDV